MERTLVERMLRHLRAWQLSLLPNDPLFTIIHQAIEDLLRANGYNLRP